MKLRSLREDNNAVLGYFIALIFSVTMLVFLFSFAIPFLTDFTTDMYVAGDNILLNAQSDINSIQNETIRERINNSLETMQSATAENIEYMGFFYQYSWIFIIVIVTFTLFILARRVVETKGSFGGVV